MVKPTFYLYRSNRKDKKYRLEMPAPYEHKHNFGAKSMRDYTLINSKQSEFYLPNKEDREKVKRAYLSRHKNDKGLGSIHAPSELSKVILWSAPTLEGGIRNYEQKHNVRVKKMF
tara:strand:- start:1089 stop:1433 length:345 start_codon:yes stop_codon:yes gene_type:complete